MKRKIRKSCTESEPTLLSVSFGLLAFEPHIKKISTMEEDIMRDLTHP